LSVALVAFVVLQFTTTFCPKVTGFGVAVILLQTGATGGLTVTVVEHVFGVDHGSPTTVNEYVVV
jgi:uncharacterized YccA/Bax inhibitor family protein